MNVFFKSISLLLFLSFFLLVISLEYGFISSVYSLEEDDSKNLEAINEYKVIFIELGSLKCIPCKQMQPIMDAIEKEYAGKVKVIFYDVWTPEGKPYAKKYSIRLIPTQIFLDKEGNEIFRHEGFFPKKEIEKVLLDAGVEK